MWASRKSGARERSIVSSPFGMAVVLLICSRPVSTGGQEMPHHALLVHLSPFSETAVRGAIDLALAKLARPGCGDIYGDFELPHGETPRKVLDRMGIGPDELLERLVFIDGTSDRGCRSGLAGLITTPGSHVISVCPRFIELQLRNPDLAASLVIHESLHVLGLGENPPSSNDITQRVQRRCWKAIH